MCVCGQKFYQHALFLPKNKVVCTSCERDITVRVNMKAKLIFNGFIITNNNNEKLSNKVFLSRFTAQQYVNKTFAFTKGIRILKTFI